MPSLCEPAAIQPAKRPVRPATQSRGPTTCIHALVELIVILLKNLDWIRRAQGTGRRRPRTRDAQLAGRAPAKRRACASDCLRRCANRARCTDCAIALRE